jgi:uncharacterized Ntn-hydrolase superfamily protein
MTFSIVAVDRRSGETGFAIASCAWDSGRVGSSRAGVGSIVSQARGNRVLRRVFFEKLEEGRSLGEILDHFREIDEGIESRQVGMITLSGRSLSFTGDGCAPWAGHRTGGEYACQGNILVGAEVVDDMVFAFENTDGSLSDRLYAALRAGDDAGGDARGKQSARILVVGGGGGDGDGTVVDVTIEDHEEPVREIGRILSIRRDLMECNRLLSELHGASGEGRLAALGEVEGFLEGREDRRYIDAWSSVCFAQMELGFEERAVDTCRKILEISPGMRGLIESMVEEDELRRKIFE